MGKPKYQKREKRKLQKPFEVRKQHGNYLVHFYHFLQQPSYLAWNHRYLYIWSQSVLALIIGAFIGNFFTNN